MARGKRTIKQEPREEPMEEGPSNENEQTPDDTLYMEEETVRNVIFSWIQ